eukprot:3351970-Prymnesium_polylepis.1
MLESLSESQNTSAPHCSLPEPKLAARTAAACSATSSACRSEWLHMSDGNKTKHFHTSMSVVESPAYVAWVMMEVRTWVTVKME